MFAPKLLLLLFAIDWFLGNEIAGFALGINQNFPPNFAIGRDVQSNVKSTVKTLSKWANEERVFKCLMMNISDYYMAESVFAMRLVNLLSVTCYTDQNFKENAHFGALNLFTSEKRLKLSYKTSINLEDLDFDFVPQHFKPCVYL